MDADWKTILANGGAAILLTVAYLLREWWSDRKRQKEREEADRQRQAEREEAEYQRQQEREEAEYKRKQEREHLARVETKIDGNTALCATTLVSSGNLPRAAPCIPAVAKALTDSAAASQSACEYVEAACGVAHDTMATQGIPQAQDVLLHRLLAAIEETREKEARHNQKNVEYVAVLKAEIERLKSDVAKVKGEGPLPDKGATRLA